MNLWEYIVCFGLSSSLEGVIFKVKLPQRRRYVSVKTSIINNRTQLIAIFTDITKFKDMDKEG